MATNKKGKTQGYQEAFVVYDKFGCPKGSSNIEYIVNDAEFKALKIIGTWWYNTQNIV